MSNNTNDKIWAVSRLPGASPHPVHVSKRLMGTPAWKIHGFQEVPDASVISTPHKSLGRPTKEISELRAQNEELKAKLEALLAAQEAKEEKEEAPKKQAKEKTQTA